jgi:topoisomerase IA-like protein
MTIIQKICALLKRPVITEEVVEIISLSEKPKRPTLKKATTRKAPAKKVPAKKVVAKKVVKKQTKKVATKCGKK